MNLYSLLTGVKILDHYKFDPEDVVLIGDAPSDIKAAKSVGVKSATVLWDCYAKEEVHRLKGDYYFSTVNELMEPRYDDGMTA